jgi:Trk-type K+ transport system membrane component
MYDEIILFSCILLLGIGIFGIVMVFRMIFRKRIITGRPPEKDIYRNFVRAWNGKIYSCATSKFLYVDKYR